MKPRPFVENFEPSPLLKIPSYATAIHLYFHRPLTFHVCREAYFNKSTLDFKKYEIKFCFDPSYAEQSCCWDHKKWSHLAGVSLIGVLVTGRKICESVQGFSRGMKNGPTQRESRLSRVPVMRSILYQLIAICPQVSYQCQALLILEFRRTTVCSFIKASKFELFSAWLLIGRYVVNLCYTLVTTLVMMCCFASFRDILCGSVQCANTPNKFPILGSGDSARFRGVRILHEGKYIYINCKYVIFDFKFTGFTDFRLFLSLQYILSFTSAFLSILQCYSLYSCTVVIPTFLLFYILIYSFLLFHCFQFFSHPIPSNLIRSFVFSQSVLFRIFDFFLLL